MIHFSTHITPENHNHLDINNHLDTRTQIWKALKKFWRFSKFYGEYITPSSSRRNMP